MNATWRYLSYLGIAALGALCGAGAILRQVHPRSTKEHQGPLPNAYFIVRPTECEGAFDFLSLFDRPEIAERLRFDGIYVLGNAADSADVSMIARAHDLRTTVRRASHSMSLQRKALGYRSAVVVVTDVDEHVLLARPVPSSVDSYVALARLLTLLPI